MSFGLKGQRTLSAATVLALILTLFLPTSASAATFTTWNQVASTASWKAIACSTNCETSYVPVSSGSIWKSIDGGATWNELTSSGARSWTAIATSGDATIVYATVSNGGVYKSSDSGSTWNLLSGVSSRAWISIATSLDGSIIAAGVSGGSIWSSIDSGANWVEQTSAGTRTWNSIDLTDDGTTIAASGSSGGGIWRGTGTAGAWSWTNTTGGKLATDSTNLSSASWYSVVLDSTGTKIGAAAGDLFFSNDSGSTWKHVTSGNYWWISLTGSSDLKTMIMVSGNGANSTCVPRLITTSDYSTFTASAVGTVWVPYNAVAIAKDASRAIAVTASSYIYRSGDSFTPILSTTTTLAVAGDVKTLEKGKSVNLTATISAAGQVTFYANSKKIGGCISKTGTTTVVCSFKPTLTGTVRLKASLKPGASYLASTSPELFLAVNKRTGTR